MKLVRFLNPKNNKVEFGCLVREQIAAIEGNPFGSFTVGNTIQNLEDTKLFSPCLPTKIIAFAANYKGATGVDMGMKEPVVFLKPSTSITGPYDPVVSYFKNMKVWGEAELAIVIGRQLSKATSQQAREAICGYLCANDITAENVEGRDHHLVRSKGSDSFCPVGPWIDTDFDPAEALIEGFQNDELIRKGKANNRIWSDEKIVCWLSQWMTLEPQDIIITGTPPRVRERVYLEDGDVYEVKISGLGNLKNKFVKEPRI